MCFFYLVCSVLWLRFSFFGPCSRSPVLLVPSPTSPVLLGFPALLVGSPAVLLGSRADQYGSDLIPNDSGHWARLGALLRVFPRETRGFRRNFVFLIIFD